MGIWNMDHTYIPMYLLLILLAADWFLISFYTPTLFSMLMAILNSRVLI